VGEVKEVKEIKEVEDKERRMDGSRRPNTWVFCKRLRKVLKTRKMSFGAGKRVGKNMKRKRTANGERLVGGKGR
jgi:hypothetical protein